MIALAEVDLNDRDTYYGGYKAPFIQAWDDIVYGLSDRNGQIQHMSFGATFSDADRWFRTELESTYPYPTNRPLIIRQIDDVDRRLEGVPRIAANGFVVDYGMPSFQGKLEGSDWLRRKYSRSKESQLGWQPLIRPEDFDINTTPTQLLSKPAPLPYGVYDDSDEQIVADTNYTTGYLPDPVTLAAVVHGAPTSPIKRRYYVTGLNAGFYPDINIRPWNDHRGETLGVMIDVPGCPDDAELALQLKTGIVTSWVELTWSCPNAGACRVYGRTGVQADGQLSGTTGGLFLADDLGGGNFRYLDGMNSVTSGPSLATVITSTVPVRNNTYITHGAGLVTTDTGSGRVKLDYTGLRWLPLLSDYYHEFLVAACAVKGNFKLYVDGVRVSATDLAANFIVPGSAEWIAGVDPLRNYFEIFGRRYTTVYARRGASIATGLISVDELSPATSILAANFDGIETVGDCSGTVITSIILQLLHFLDNALVPDRPINAQAWVGASPLEFTAIPGLTYVDQLSFTDLDTTEGAALQGGWIVGFNQEAVGAEDAIARFLLSIDAELCFSRQGQAYLTREPDTLPVTTTYKFDDVINIKESTLKIADQVGSNFYNLMPYRWGPDYSGRTSGGRVFTGRGLSLNLPSNHGWQSVVDFGEVNVYDSNSTFNYDQIIPRKMLDLYGIMDAATAAPILARTLRRYSNAMRAADFEIPLAGSDIAPGDVFTISAADGIGAAGWVNKMLRCKGYRQRCGTNTIVLNAYDLERAINASAVIVTTP